MSRNDNAIGGSGARSGIYTLNNYSAYIKAGAWWAVAGQEEFLLPGTYNWVCPPGVRRVSAVCVGAGGGGNATWATNAGGGGGLGWKNNIPVTPGNTYTVVVGQGGSRGSTNATKGTMSYFINSSTVGGGGGGGGGTGAADPMDSSANGSGGGYTGDGGGKGGSGASYQGGGGAGGYNANGGNYTSNGDQNGGSAAGGGYYSSTYGVSAGGGTGIYGKRTDYQATRNGHGHVNEQGNGVYAQRGLRFNQVYGPSSVGGGRGGSYRVGTISGEETGWNGASGENPWSSGSNSGIWSNNANNLWGGFPGGGGGGPGTSWGGGNGASGAVRIIWAGEKTNTNRAYPSTSVEDVV